MCLLKIATTSQYLGVCCPETMTMTKTITTDPISFNKCAKFHPGPVLHFFNIDIISTVLYNSPHSIRIWFIAIIFTIKADGLMSQSGGHRPPGRGRVSPPVINF